MQKQQEERKKGEKKKGRKEEGKKERGRKEERKGKRKEKKRKAGKNSPAIISHCTKEIAEIQNHKKRGKSSSPKAVEIMQGCI